MRILSLGQIVGMAVTIITLMMAAGRADLVWKGIGYLRYHALKNASQPWGCPSTTKGACSSYDPNRYR